MTNMKKTIQFVVIGTILALTAPAYADTLTNKIAVNKLATNKLATNKLAVNKLALNKLALNKLALNKLAANGIIVEQDPFEGAWCAAAGEGAVDDIVGVELPDGTTFIR